MDSRSFPQSDHAAKVAHGSEKPDGGDIVLIQDSNQVRGNWKLGQVSKVKPGDDGKVRNVVI